MNGVNLPETEGALIRIRYAIWSRLFRLKRCTHEGRFAQFKSPIVKVIRAVIRALAAWSRPRIGEFEMSDYHVWLQSRETDATYRLCKYGVYGFYFADYLRQQRAPFVFLDIGANVGVYSLVALQNPACKFVVAFEPVPSTLKFLNNNLRRQARSAYRIVPAAISSRSGTSAMSVPKAHSGAASLGPLLDEREDVETVSVSTIDSLGLKRLWFPPDRLVVKIDVEGHEADVLETLFRAFPSGVDALWIEFSTRTNRPRAEMALNLAGFTEVHRVGNDDYFDALWVCRNSLHAEGLR